MTMRLNNIYSVGEYFFTDFSIENQMCIRDRHTGGEPDGDNDKRADDGGLPAKLLLLGGLSDGGKHRGPEMPRCV